MNHARNKLASTSNAATGWKSRDERLRDVKEQNRKKTHDKAAMSYPSPATSTTTNIPNNRNRPPSGRNREVKVKQEHINPEIDDSFNTFQQYFGQKEGESQMPVPIFGGGLGSKQSHLPMRSDPTGHGWGTSLERETMQCAQPKLEDQVIEALQQKVKVYLIY